MKLSPTTTSDRYQAIQKAVNLCFEKGFFRREIIQISEDRLEQTISEYYEFLNKWKGKISDDPDRIILDRHKVGALTAICIMNCQPLNVIEPKEKLNSFETLANEYLSILIAIARIVQDVPPHHLKRFQFNERAFSILIPGIKIGTWKPRELALLLFEMEGNLLSQIEDHHKI